MVDGSSDQAVMDAFMNPHSWSMVLLDLGALMLLVWSIGSFMVWHTQDSAIFVGNGAEFGENSRLLALGGKAVRAQREGQALRWYWIGAENSRATVLFFHGNYDGALERLDFAEAFKPSGISVALVEFPGYAGDSSPVGEWPLLRNSLAAFDEIRAGIGTRPLFVMGESLGTGPATYTAAMRRPRGLILSTPYTSMADVAKHRYPWVPIHTLIRHPIKAKLWAPHVQCPVLILHGTKDRTIPYSIGQAEASNFKHVESFVTIPGAGHGDLRTAQNGQFWTASIDFMLRHAQ
jgi:alpha-beta hydrolase superfamily lysophospholipase